MISIGKYDIVSLILRDGASRIKLAWCINIDYL